MRPKPVRVELLETVKKSLGRMPACSLNLSVRISSLLASIKESDERRGFQVVSSLTASSSRASRPDLSSSRRICPRLTMLMDLMQGRKPIRMLEERNPKWNPRCSVPSEEKQGQNWFNTSGAVSFRRIEWESSILITK